MSRISRLIAVFGCAALAGSVFGCSKPEEAASPAPEASAAAPTTTTQSSPAAPTAGTAPASGAGNSGMQSALSNPNTPPDVKAKIQNYQSGK